MFSMDTWDMVENPRQLVALQKKKQERLLILFTVNCLVYDIIG